MAVTETSAVSDIAHIFGSDIQASPQGDLATVQAVTRSQERVLRRLLTNPGDYIFHPPYGAGLRKWVGAVIDIPAITAAVRGQMLAEETVLPNPEPTIVVTAIPNGCRVDLSYLVAPDAQPAALTFDVDK